MHLPHWPSDMVWLTTLLLCFLVLDQSSKLPHGVASNLLIMQIVPMAMLVEALAAVTRQWRHVMARRSQLPVLPCAVSKSVTTGRK